MSDAILFHSSGLEEHRYLSAFYSRMTEIDGERWFSVEHYFQAQKCLLPEDRKRVKFASSAAVAKRIAASVQARPDWEDVKQDVMLRAIRAKFQQHPDLRERLLATENRELIHYAPWGDTYWGVDKDMKGLNVQGKLTMQVREELR